MLFAGANLYIYSSDREVVSTLKRGNLFPADTAEDKGDVLEKTSPNGNGTGSGRCLVRPDKSHLLVLTSHHLFSLVFRYVDDVRGIRCK